MSVHPLPILADPSSDVGAIAELVDRDGTISHPYCTPAIARAPGAFVCDAAAFADAVHFLGLLHMQLPGVIDHASTRVVDQDAREWMLAALRGFAAERAYLAQLIVAVGPLPSTAGQHQVAAIMTQQHRALEMLARSDRRGTALGAAMALVLDWAAIHAVLHGGAVRMGIDAQDLMLPGRAETLHVLGRIDGDAGVRRALLFGASQLLTQHRGLWDLLEARAGLRAESV